MSLETAIIKTKIEELQGTVTPDMPAATRLIVLATLRDLLTEIQNASDARHVQRTAKLSEIYVGLRDSRNLE